MINANTPIQENETPKKIENTVVIEESVGAPQHEKEPQRGESIILICYYCTFLLLFGSIAYLLHVWVERMYPSVVLINQTAAWTIYTLSFVRLSIATIITTFPILLLLFFLRKRSYETKNFIAIQQRGSTIMLCIAVIGGLIGIIYAVYDSFTGSGIQNVLGHGAITILLSFFMFFYFFSDIKKNE